MFPDQASTGPPGSYLNLPNIDPRSVFVPRAGVVKSAEQVPVTLMKEPL